MSPNTLLLLYAFLAVLALIVLIAVFKLHPFVALVVVSLGLGVAAGMPLSTVVKAFQDGVGGVLGFVAVVVALGTMLGKMMAESGGAARIATTLIGVFGERRVHWAIMVVAFIVGIPVFFQVGFVLLVPLVFTIARRTGMSLVKIGIPLVVGLSVVHGMLPPHPAAMLAVGAYRADVGRTILYGLLVGVPTAALAGPIFAAWIAPRIAAPLENPLATQLEGSSNILAAPPRLGDRGTHPRGNRIGDGRDDNSRWNRRADRHRDARLASRAAGACDRSRFAGAFARERFRLLADQGILQHDRRRHAQDM